MFVLIFVLLFAKSFQVNGLECMQEKAAITGKVFTWGKNIQNKLQDPEKIFTGTPEGCFFTQSTGEPLLDDEELSQTYSCAIRSSNLAMIAGDEDYSCYVQVAIDYRSGTMAVQLNLVREKSDKLFRDVTEGGQKAVVQYEIKGDFDTDALGMITRVQCNTGKNCALEEIRKLLPNLIQAENRLRVFEKIDEILNEPESTALMCYNSDNKLALSCPLGAKYCKYEFESDSNIDKGCKTIDLKNDVLYQIGFGFIPDYDVKYRYSELLESTDEVKLDPKGNFAYVFECKTDKCNSDENAISVEDLLLTFVKNPSIDPSKSDKQNQYNSPFAHTVKKNGSNSLVSYQSMIIFTLFLRFFI